MLRLLQQPADGRVKVVIKPAGVLIEDAFRSSRLQQRFNPFQLRGLQVGQMEPKARTAAFHGLADWQFRGAVFFGDTIRVKRTIGPKKEWKNPKQGFVEYHIEVLNQEDKAVQKGVWNMLIFRREEG